MATIMAVSNETQSTMSRVTKEGRHLTYELVVIQQPERARACGSGAKSSADRRPVDPPPVVELRILEGEAKTDVTFAYNANFFLYTTLENARPIAQGRVPTATTTFPVLTGMPVAGMAYLDRPGPAGYFIFPDLSVRHEGKYRLSFNLYEELKDHKDADAEPPARSPMDTRPRNPLAPQNHVHFRLEVKSKPFNVYSAKKFPGLAESTSLSRIVAEQGCRVRIRRDVRMRRRDTKSTKGFDDWDEEPTFTQESTFGQTYQQPTQPAPRPQSAQSGYSTFQRPPQHTPQPQNTNPGYTPYPQPPQQTPQPQRPESQNSVYSSYQQPSPSSAQPQSANSGFTSHLSFGASSSSTQYQTPAFHPPAGPALQPMQNYLSTNSGYQYPTHSRQLSNPQNGVYSQAQTSQHSPQSAAFNPAQSMPSTPQSGEYSQPQTSQSNSQNGYSLAQPSQISDPPNKHSLAPPLSYSQNKFNLIEPSQVSSASQNKFSLVEPSQMANSQHGGFKSMIAATTPAEGITQYSYAVTPQIRDIGGTRTGKRPFGKVFNQEHITQPMHSGMRPDCSGQDLAQIEAEDGSQADEYEIATMKVLAYKRADGTKGIKRCPTSASDSD